VGAKRGVLVMWLRSSSEGFHHSPESLGELRWYLIRLAQGLGKPGDEPGLPDILAGAVLQKAGEPAAEFSRGAQCVYLGRVPARAVRAWPEPVRGDCPLVIGEQLFQLIRAAEVVDVVIWSLMQNPLLPVSG
jgi:hypothetical protein